MKCDTELLWTLVSQDAEPGEHAEAVARHLEYCQSCREKLASIGGDPVWWSEAKQWLAEDPSPPGGEEFPSMSVDLSFLQQPAHPEMLGRLGRYDVEALIGRGGMGVVLRAYDSDLHRSVAIKVLAPEWAASAQARRRFAREAQAAASVAHENVIPIYNVDAEAKQPFLVMQYVPGMTLQAWIEKHGPPPAEKILRVASQLAEGLAAAHHRGLVHRDIKPGNVLVGENIDRVWITDFGLARAADSMTLTRTGVIVGTPHYMSPEQARGESIDHRSDLFSLGSVLYFLATGKPPFDADNTLAVLHQLCSGSATPLTQSRDDLPPSFVVLVERLLKRPRNKRPENCQLVIQMLDNAREQLLAGKVAKRKMRRRSKIALASISCVLVFASIETWYLSQPSEQMNRRLGNFVPRVGRINSELGYEPVHPYVVRASQQIESATRLDDLRFQTQLSEIAREIQRIQQTDFSIGVPRLSAGDDAWHESVSQLQRLIENKHD